MMMTLQRQGTGVDRWFLLPHPSYLCVLRAFVVSFLYAAWDSVVQEQTRSLPIKQSQRLESRS
jgi:hypothetical protein